MAKKKKEKKKKIPPEKIKKLMEAVADQGKTNPGGRK